jgi:hypothetical protein
VKALTALLLAAAAAPAGLIGPAAIGMSPAQVYSIQDGRAALAAWHIYRAGIAFRAVRLLSEPEWSATITCIAVFRPAADPVLGDACSPQQGR